MTSAEAPRSFPAWQQIYAAQAVETMPWFYDKLDPDLEAALSAHSVSKGTLLDLGTGPGTQAISLALAGLSVTGSDLSEDAVKLAQARAVAAGASVTFIADDVLASKLTGPFDYIFDRGCFHVLAPELRAKYLQTVSALLPSKGLLFLKCFSSEQPGENGPYRFTPQMVQAAFSEGFTVLSTKDTVYQGTLQPLPKALFTVLQRR